jgi:hypothetical protein
VNPSQRPRGNLHGFKPSIVSDMRLSVDFEYEAFEGIAFIDGFVGLENIDV